MSKGGWQCRGLHTHNGREPPLTRIDQVGTTEIRPGRERRLPRQQPGKADVRGLEVRRQLSRTLRTSPAHGDPHDSRRPFR